MNTTTASDLLEDALETIKPKLRGWLHVALAPVALGLGIAYAIAASGVGATVGVSVFTGAALLLFSVSGIYHTRAWSPSWQKFWKKFDHANIFVMIAGSYTPFAVMLLDGTLRTLLLSLVWTGAGLGAVFRLTWTDAPRWLYVACYIILGWSALLVADEMIASGGVVVISLVAAGGLLYTIGGVVYGLKKPNPIPSWFGFHEIFHACTALAFAAHLVALGLLVW